MSEWLAHPYATAALERSVAAFDGARLMGVLADPWRPDLAATVLVTYDWPRLAGLRSWREQFETHFISDAHTYIVTTYECGYLCRLMTRGVGRAVVCARGRVLQDMDGSLAELGELASHWWDDRAAAWLNASGLDRPAGVDLGGPGIPPSDRFELLDAWVVKQRTPMAG